MNKNININIEDQAFINYFSLQKNIYNNLIIQEINKSSKVVFSEFEKYVRFKYDDCIVFTCHLGSLIDVTKLSYDEVIPKAFLDNLINNKERLNFRISRLADLEYIDILKQEIINALVLERIKLKYDKCNDFIIASWNSLEMKFSVSNDIIFADIIDK